MVRTTFSSPLFRLVAIVACAFFGPVLPAALAQTPTPDQIEIFRNLPADQQQAIMESLNRGGSTSGSRGTSVDRRLEFPQTVQPRERVREGEEEEGAIDPATGLPRQARLKGNDTVLLSLEVRRFKRRAPELEERERREQQQATMQPTIPGRQLVAPPAASDRASGAGGAAADAETQVLVERTEEETQRLEDFRERVLRRNPYQLDKWGILSVPELGPIPLGGLTEEQATQRVSAELRLEDYIVVVVRLPLKPVGTEALKPFGYDLFAGMPSTFAPATDVPVPSDYVVGPGDIFEVQLFGNVKGRYTLVVGRDGRINFPELGPIAVSGRRFEQVRDDLQDRCTSR